LQLKELILIGDLIITSDFRGIKSVESASSSTVYDSWNEFFLGFLKVQKSLGFDAITSMIEW